jgi:hypothetical protein
VVFDQIDAADRERADLIGEQCGGTELRQEGVRVLLGPGEFEPHKPGTGGSRLDAFPWELTLNEAERMQAQTVAHKERLI